MGLPQSPRQSGKVASISSDAAQLGKPVSLSQMPVAKSIKEGLITGAQLKDHGNITAPHTRVRDISAELGGQLNLDNDVSERSTMKSEPINRQDEYLEHDVINRTAPPSAEVADSENGGMEFRSISPAGEVEGNPGTLCRRYEGLSRIRLIGS